MNDLNNHYVVIYTRFKEPKLMGSLFFFMHHCLRLAWPELPNQEFWSTRPDAV
jgi:hypothetical protein